MAFEIEKGIPLPGRCSIRNPADYPFGDMEVGDSFFVPFPLEEMKRGRSRLSVASSARKKAYPSENYATREVDGGYRAWRTE